MKRYSTNSESAMLEFYGWFEPAEAYLESAKRSSSDGAYPQIALGYLQLAAEYAFKAVIMSIGLPMQTRDPYVLSTRCRRLVPGLQNYARLYSPEMKRLFFFLDPDYYKDNPRLPREYEWKKLLQIVKQFLKVVEIFFKARVYQLYS